MKPNAKIEVTDAIVNYMTMLEYNRGYEHTLHVIDVALERVKTGNHSMQLEDDDLDFYAFVILLCGDYGTSPRFGWFDEKDKHGIIKCLDAERRDILRALEDEKDEN